MQTRHEGTLLPWGYAIAYPGQVLSNLFAKLAQIAKITGSNFRKYLKKYKAVLSLLCPRRTPPGLLLLFTYPDYMTRETAVIHRGTLMRPTILVAQTKTLPNSLSAP